MKKYGSKSKKIKFTYGDYSAILTLYDIVTVHNRRISINIVSFRHNPKKKSGSMKLLYSSENSYKDFIKDLCDYSYRNGIYFTKFNS